jgi:hypothetical protein
MPTQLQGSSFFFIVRRFRPKKGALPISSQENASKGALARLREMEMAFRLNPARRHGTIGVC